MQDPSADEAPAKTFTAHGSHELATVVDSSDSARRRHGQLLSDKVRMLRAAITDEELLEHLSGFVRIHPRFDTELGWEQWFADVTQLAGLAGGWPGPRNRRVKAKSTEELAARYAKGFLDASEFWQGLDELVSSAGLSSTAQRELFWTALSPRHQNRVLAYCAAFHPEHAVWRKPESGDAKLAEQRLSRTMEFLRLDDGMDIRSDGAVDVFLVIAFWACVAVVLCNVCVLIICAARKQPLPRYSLSVTVFDAFLILFRVAGSLYGRSETRKMQAKKRELLRAEA